MKASLPISRRGRARALTRAIAFFAAVALSAGLAQASHSLGISHDPDHNVLVDGKGLQIPVVVESNCTLADVWVVQCRDILVSVIWQIGVDEEGNPILRQVNKEVPHSPLAPVVITVPDHELVSPTFEYWVEASQNSCSFDGARWFCHPATARAPGAADTYAYELE